jgi:uncharacterized protein YkwD
MSRAFALATGLVLCAGCGEGTSPFTAGTDIDGDTDTDTDTDADTDDPAEACHESAAGWPAEWAAAEDQVVDLVNSVRAEGADCGDAGVFEPAAPLVMEPHLQCACRVHSLDMATRGYFGHDSPDGPLGENLYERAQNAGYEGIVLGESIAANEDEAEVVVQSWLGSSTSCARMLNPGAAETGVGFAYLEGSPNLYYWTQVFGDP